jgi:hypothetical protein
MICLIQSGLTVEFYHSGASGAGFMLRHLFHRAKTLQQFILSMHTADSAIDSVNDID